MGGGTQPPHNETFTVTFHANAPSGTVASGTMTRQTFVAGTPFTLAKNAFSIEGYTFRGWSDSSWEAEPLYADEMEITLSADIALYAVWKEAGTPPEDENQFTVTFYANAPNGTVASGTMTPQAFTSGTVQALTKNTFSIEGYTFIGWAESPEATEATYADGQEIIVSSDTMLYAMWEKEDPPKSIPELLKEIISDYDLIAAKLEDGITITELTITVVGDVFYDSSEATNAENIQSIVNKAVQEGGDKAEIETALVAQAESLLKISKPEECKYSFSKTELALIFTGDFDIDKTYLIIEDGYMDVDLSGAIITANHTVSLEEFESIFLDLNPQVTQENFNNYFMGGGSGAETPKDSLKATLNIVPNDEGNNSSLHMRLLIALSNYYGSTSGKLPGLGM